MSILLNFIGEYGSLFFLVLIGLVTLRMLAAASKGSK